MGLSFAVPKIQWDSNLYCPGPTAIGLWETFTFYLINFSGVFWSVSAGMRLFKVLADFRFFLYQNIVLKK